MRALLSTRVSSSFFISSHASQNNRFSSLYSERKNSLKYRRPAAKHTDKNTLSTYKSRSSATTSKPRNVMCQSKFANCCTTVFIIITVQWAAYQYRWRHANRCIVFADTALQRHEYSLTDIQYQSKTRNKL